MSYAQIFETFPSELRLPIAHLVDALRGEFEIKRADFADLKAAVQELAAAQARTETRLEELAAAQARTETRLEELATAQARTEARLDRLSEAVEKLAEAQTRTEVRVEQLAAAQQRTQDELTLFRRAFTSQLGGLGARWGLQTEEAFRQGMRAILEEVGFTTERFLVRDTAGEVFGQPDQVELDVVVRNGKVIVVEIKSSLDRGNTHLFNRKVAFYTHHTGRQVDRKVIITPYADDRAQDIARHLGIEICTDVTAFK